MKLFLPLCLTALIIISCAPGVDIDLGTIINGEAPTVAITGVPDIEPNVLTAIASGPLIDKNLGSCITSDFQLNPQPFRVDGAPFRVDGAPFRVDGATGEVETDYSQAISPSYVSDYFSNTFSEQMSLGQPSRDVAIIVLDEFLDTFSLGKLLFEIEDLSPEMLVEFELEGVTSHGALVMNHINGIMAGLGTYTPLQIAKDTLEWRHNETGAKLLIKAVAPNDFNTEAVGNQLSAAIRDLKTQGFNNIVVNMSFVILPCSIVKDFVLNKLVYPSLFDYVESLIADNTGSFMRSQGIPAVFSDEVSTRVSDLIVESFRPVDPEGDPLRLSMLANPDVLFIGAAGNFGRAVSAYPAFWDEVLSVSASKPTDKAEFSNTGEVMLAGAWFRLSNPLGLNGHDLAVANVVYAGTSFAAPGVSVFSALDLASTSRCGLVDGRSRLSLFNQADVPLEKAVREACQ